MMICIVGGFYRLPCQWAAKLPGLTIPAAAADILPNVYTRHRHDRNHARKAGPALHVNTVQYGSSLVDEISKKAFAMVYGG